MLKFVKKGDNYVKSIYYINSSTDKGKTWFPEICLTNTMYSMAMIGDKNNVFVCGNDFIFILHDTGNTWKYYNGMQGTNIFYIADKYILNIGNNTYECEN